MKEDLDRSDTPMATKIDVAPKGEDGVGAAPATVVVSGNYKVAAISAFVAAVASILGTCFVISYGDNDCGDVTQALSLPQPILPGIRSGSNKAKLVFAQDIDWPPYAYLGVPPESDFDVAGFGHDVAFGMGDYCGLDVTVVQTGWSECWNAGAIGAGLQRGEFHACMTYTHTAGQRNRFVEFSNGILKANKPAGLLVMLNDDGTPKVDGTATSKASRWWT